VKEVLSQRPYDQAGTRFALPVKMEYFVKTSFGLGP
jgi:hypothetical protein